MPTYEYHCDSCDRNFDVVQSFHDDPLETCPTCDSPIRKIFGNVGIVFKGSGFYKNDSRTSAASKDGDGPPKDGKDASKSTGDGPSAGGSGETPSPASPSTKGDSASTTTSTPSTGNGSPTKAKESTTT